MFSKWLKRRGSSSKRQMLRLLNFQDPSTICSHLFLMGASGSGKSSAIRRIMPELLDAGHSCIWFGVKASEAQTALDVIGSTRMRDRLIHLRPGSFTFNVAAFEMGRVGGSPATFARLLDRLGEMLSRSSSSGEDGAFWKGLQSNALEAASTIAYFAFRDKVTLEHIYELISQCPANAAQTNCPDFKKKFFYSTFHLAEANLKNDAELHALKQSVAFFVQRVATIGEKGRGAMMTSCANILMPLLRSPVYETLCSETSTYTPEMPLQGYCVVVDYPVLVYQDSALLLQNLLSMLTTESALRRGQTDQITICVKDEYQLLCASPEFDCMAMSVARSHGLSFIAAAQSLPLLRVAMGGNSQGEQFALSLLGNFNTQLVFANQCSETSHFYSRAWGEHREDFISVNESQPEENFDLMNMMFGPDRFMFSVAEQMATRCPPENFLRLRRGSPVNKCIVDCYLTQGGRTFGKDHDPFTLISFKQA